MKFTFANIVAYGLVGIIKENAGLSGAGFMFLLLGGILLTAGAGYLLGSINPAIILSKGFFGGDIRNYGSGNAGMTNMFRVFGKKAGLLTLLGDVLKTVVATLVGYFIFGNVPFLFQNGFVLFGRLGPYVAGLFCVLGHIFPIYYGFRGGKGVLVTAVVLLMTDWPVLCMLLVVFGIVLAGTGMVSLASVMSALMMPLLLNIWYKMFNYSADARVEGGISLTIAVVIAVLVVLKHAENIKRIREGQEPKVRMPWQKKREGGNKGVSAASLEKSGSGMKKNSRTGGKSLSEKDK